MNELMIHIERIVRPVRAGEALKLRMRRELLAHLQAALDDELQRSPDKSIAIAQAVKRLGEPTELTSQLQQSVPRLHRILLNDIPGTSLLDRRTPEFISGIDALNDGPMIHALLLLIPACVLSILVAVLSASGLVTIPVNGIDVGSDYPRIMLLVALLGLFASVVACGGFVLAMAGLSQPPRLLRCIGHGLGAIGSQVLFLMAMGMVIRGRLIGKGDVIRSLILTLMLLLLLSVIARAVAAMRRAYQPWLSLDVSD